MRIAMADDSIQDIEHLKAELTMGLAEFGYSNESMDTFANGDELVATFETGKYDLIFLDIYMGDVNGIDTATEIRRKDNDVRLIFCTSSNDYAAQSYRLSADYYLLKPYTSEDVRRMLSLIDLEKYEAQRMVEFPDKSSCRIHDILYTEYSNHKITIHLAGNNEHCVWISHTELEKILGTKGDFFTCTKGVMVNLEKIVSFEEDSVKLCTGELVPVSRARRPELRKAHSDFILRTLHKGRKPQ
ncbi:MAG: response regulator transcription factor [Lachnospiraceae bacterium]|nr:response regulator transcription factor [Lachnospiraceae bacterium]